MAGSRVLRLLLLSHCQVLAEAALDVLQWLVHLFAAAEPKRNRDQVLQDLPGLRMVSAPEAADELQAGVVLD